MSMQLPIIFPEVPKGKRSSRNFDEELCPQVGRTDEKLTSETCLIYKMRNYRAMAYKKTVVRQGISYAQNIVRR